MLIEQKKEHGFAMNHWAKMGKVQRENNSVGR